MPRSRLEALEQADFDLLVPVAWLALDAVPLLDAELKAARRRAMLVLASGGDPSRDVGLDSPAVERLASELDSPARREALAEALRSLDAEGLPRVSEALNTLLGDPELAWRAFALALLADELADE